MRDGATDDITVIPDEIPAAMRRWRCRGYYVPDEGVMVTDRSLTPDQRDDQVIDLLRAALDQAPAGQCGFRPAPAGR